LDAASLTLQIVMVEAISAVYGSKINAGSSQVA
jgi:hypothetical protein